MGKVRFTTEQIIRKLREAEVLHSQGAKNKLITIASIGEAPLTTNKAKKKPAQSLTRIS